LLDDLVQFNSLNVLERRCHETSQAGAEEL
jgi:hypothetical protein